MRERNRAGRGDLFRVRDGDIWGTIQAARLPVLDRIVESVRQAAHVLPPGSHDPADVGQALSPLAGR